ncbi:KEX1 protease precursor [Patellaria atrata CBS 101060]|uniref:KEX1 protease n=1 Tax=Patellaria atrata CBS 101060 TaxID=1346257 RepID=A0A9P4S3A3_9PEZI|nr:KEX1 protease precursor [Patellaria atrata CBS 101060]
MRKNIIWILAIATSCVLGGRLRPRNYDTHDFYALHLDPTTSPSELATFLGLEHDGQLGELVDHHIFRAPKDGRDVITDAVEELKRRRRKRNALEPSILDGILFNQKQKLKPRMVKRDILYPELSDIASDHVLFPRQDAPPVDSAVVEQNQIRDALEIRDPVFQNQWHLFNTRQPGNDLNVTGVWMQGITGKNATVCIIDDGLDMDSDDLSPNYFAIGSYDFNDHVEEPKPRLSDDRHGTRCAGEVSAARNDVCGVGVAYDSKIAGVRILSAPITDADEAIAVNYEFHRNDIYSCSWGPPDDGRTMDAPGILIRRAFVNAIQKGRNNKGSIYVFAAGNGASSDDNCNFDGYTNSIYSVTVGSVSSENHHPYYSEKCSAQLIVTYSSSRVNSITTTDVGKNECTSSHGGTSAAGPLAAGVYALVLQIRPDLSWRDIQWLTVMTGVKFTDDSDWQQTGAGRFYSHQYGYGKMDAWAMVEAAKTWKSVKPQAWYHSPWIHVKHEIPQGDQGLASIFTVTEDMLREANFERLEHVTLTMNVEHTRRGDLSVELRSPTGVISHIATARKMDDKAAGYVDWTFMSVAHFGESAVGNWTVIVKDTKVNEHTGTFTDWKLRLWGECIDGANQPLFPLPNETDDDDHDATVTAPVATTSVHVPSETEHVAQPTDHPSRPVNSKPPASTTTPFEPPITTSPSPSAIPDESFLPSPFPTFGVSKRTQIWIYGALALIIVFCASLALYFWLARRKRLRNNPRGDYEFEMIDDQDDDGATRQGLTGSGGARRGKNRRAGELYDAFAGESDEELLSESESENETYRDDAPENFREKHDPHVVGSDDE